MTQTAPVPSRHAVAPTHRGRQPVPSGPDEQHELVRIRRLCGIGTWQFDLVTGVLSVSDELLQMCGLDRAAVAVSGWGMADAVVAEDRDRVVAAMERLVQLGESVSLRFRAQRPGEAHQIWLSARGQGEHDVAGRLLRVMCAITDISELVQAETDLRNTHADLLQAHGYQQAVIATTPDAIHVYDVRSGRYERANRSGSPLFGYTPQAVAVMGGERFDELVPPQDLAALEAGLRAACDLPDGAVHQLRHRVYNGDNGWSWLSRRVSVFERADDGSAASLLVVTRDVTDTVAVELRLEHAATHDDLTGLPNRRHAYDQLAAMTDTEVALLVIDLDGFKQINDFYGHASGDALLRGAARRLRSATRNADLVARLGGDEFLVLLRARRGAALPEHAASIAARIETLFAEPFMIDGQECSVTASIGISVTRAGASPETVLAEADAAMYAVKHRGANGHAVFDTALADQAARDDHVERNLRRAVHDGTIDVHYQPIVDPRLGTVESVEALVRIRDAAGTLLDTGLVVSVAERCGLVSAIDDLVLTRACRQVAAWRADPRYATLRLAVNRSARDILRAGFHDRVMTVLHESELPASALTVEVTETVLLDARDRSIAEVRRLTDRGVGLAIDDFGTGYASLSQLTTLPVTAIKIDRSFTRDMLADATCGALVRASIGLAADLGLLCVVEGVETPGQLTALPPYDRMRVQGYLYGRPRPAEDGLDVTRQTA